MASEHVTETQRLSRSDLQRLAMHGWLWTMLHTAVSLPTVVLANIFVARLLGPSQYGHLAFLTAAFATMGTVANAGVQTAMVQWGAETEARGEPRATDALLAKGLGFHLLVEAPVLSVGVLLLVNRDGTGIQALLLLGVVVATAFAPSSIALVAANRVDQQAKLAIIGVFVVQMLGLLAAIGTRDAAYVFAARLAAGGLLAPSHLVFLSRARRRAVTHPRLPRGLKPAFWRFALQSCLATVVTMLVFSRSEVFVLQAFDKNVALGLFALAFGLAAQITAPIDGLLGPMLPAMAGLAATDARAGPAAVERGTRFSGLGAGVILVAIVPAVFVLIPLLYGRAFGPSAWAFFPLALVSCLQSTVQTVSASILGRREAGVLLRINVLTLGVNAAVAITLIPLFGLAGAVVANSVGQLAALAFLVRAELRATGTTWAAFRRCLTITVTAAVVAALVIAATIPLVSAAGDGAAARIFTALGAAVLGLFGLAISIRIFGVRLPAADLAALEKNLSPSLWSVVAPATRALGLTAPQRPHAA